MPSALDFFEDRKVESKPKPKPKAKIKSGAMDFFTSEPEPVVEEKDPSLLERVTPIAKKIKRKATPLVKEFFEDVKGETKKAISGVKEIKPKEVVKGVMETVKSIPDLVVEGIKKRRSFDAYAQSLPSEKEVGARTMNTREYFEELDPVQKVSHMSTMPAMLAGLGYTLYQGTRGLSTAVKMSGTKPQKPIILSRQQAKSVRDHFNLGKDLPKELKTLTPDQLAKSLRESTKAHQSLSKQAIKGYKPPGAIVKTEKAPFGGYLESGKPTKIQPKIISEPPMATKPIPTQTPKSSSALGIISPEMQEFNARLEELAHIKNKFIGAIDIEAPFRHIDAPDTGLAIKTSTSKMEAGEQRGLDTLNKLNKMNLTPEEYSQVSSLASMSKLPEETPPHIQEAVNFVRGEFDRDFSLLKERGVLTKPFPESYVDRLDDDINFLRSQKDSLSPKAKVSKQDIENKITDLESTRDALSQAKFVHLPVRLWFESEGKYNPEGFKRSLASFRNIKPKAGRKTISIQDLVDAGVITPEQADIRRILPYYKRYIYSQLAEKDIIDAAEIEGLALPISKAPEDWVEIPTRYVPQLKDMKVHPIFADYLENHIKATQRGGAFEQGVTTVLGGVKMLQFYNPVFLSMYDVVQASILGSAKVIPTDAGAIRKAFKSMKERDANYYEAADNGLFSTPFRMPFDEFQKNIEQSITKSDTPRYALEKLKGIVKNPTRVLGDIYQLSWNTAWAGDRAIRLYSYNWLKNKGYSPKEAAQLAAKFHGDYASVPAGTRKMMNKALFTGTFKIAMGKLYGSMIKNTMKKFMGAKNLGKEGNRFVYGAVATLLAIPAAVDAMMTKMGDFEREEYARKYVRKEMTSEGEKELVVTFANPANLLQRYYYRFKPKPGETNYLNVVARGLSYEIHPVYRIAGNLVKNQRMDGSPIYNPFDNQEKQIRDVARFTISNVYRISEGILKDETIPDKQKMEAINSSKKKLWYKFLSPFTFSYIRNVRDVRMGRKAKSLRNMFRGFMIKDEPKNEKEMKERQENLLKKIDSLELGKEE